MSETVSLEALMKAEEGIVREVAKTILGPKEGWLVNPDTKDVCDYSMFLLALPEIHEIDILAGADIVSLDQELWFDTMLGLIAQVGSNIHIFGHSHRRKDKAIEIEMHFTNNMSRWRITKTPDGDRSDCVCRRESKMVPIMMEMRSRIFNWMHTSIEHIEDVARGLRTDLPGYLFEDEAFMNLSRRAVPDIDEDVLLDTVKRFTTALASQVMNMYALAAKR